MKKANTLNVGSEIELYKSKYKCFEIGSKRQLELFLSNDDNNSSSRADHDDDYCYIVGCIILYLSTLT